ncbi:ParB/RepB/Spo0J family partition protein [Promicromonospora soli]
MPNDDNPRLDFPQDELDRLAQSIDQEGVLVPIVVYPRAGKFVLVDGERRFRCSRDLGLETIPAVVTAERTEREVLQQMFNIHLIREPWRDIPTAKALQRLADQLREEEGREPTDKELREKTGLSIERVRQLRYVTQLPDEWQRYIREETIPLNFFWELKKNVVDPMRKKLPSLYDEFGEESLGTAFVDKRLNQVITDTVSLRKMNPIISLAALDAENSPTGKSDIDNAIRDLITRQDATIEDAYDDTVQMMVEVDKLGRRTTTMLAAFTRLLSQAREDGERAELISLGRRFTSELNSILDVYNGQSLG